MMGLSTVVVVLAILVALAAAIALATSRVPGPAMSRPLTVAQLVIAALLLLALRSDAGLVKFAALPGLTDAQHEKWFLLTLSFVLAAIFEGCSVESVSDRRGVAWLLAGQAAAMVAALGNDLRVIGPAAAGAVLAPLLALHAGAGDANDGRVTAQREALARWLTLVCVGAVLLGVGLMLGVFGEAAIRARSTGESASLRFHWPVVETTLLRAAINGGSAGGIVGQLAPWMSASLVLGFGMLAGLVPFHRGVGTALRLASPTLRLLTAAMLLAATAVVGGRLVAPFATLITPDVGWPVLLALLTQWLGAFLILARGDLSRLTAAIVLMASGQIAGAVLLPASAGPGVAWLVSAGLIVPVAAIASLLAWLQQTYGSHEFNDYHGLSRVLPRFSAALAVAVLWFCGVPLLSVFPGLWAICMHRIPFAGLETFALWIVLVPQLIAAWGGLRILDGLLLGEPRLPKMPEILNDRIEIHGGIRSPDRDLERPELSSAAILVAIGLLLGLGGFSAFLGADPVAAEAVDPQPADSL